MMMWTAGVWTALVLSSIIGLSLGLVGGGGSIVTVPILVYVAGLPPREAIALSLNSRHCRDDPKNRHKVL